MNAKTRNKIPGTTETEPVDPFLESILVASKRAEWENFFNNKILKARVQLCGSKREREPGTSRSAEKRRALADRVSTLSEGSALGQSKPSQNSEGDEENATPITAKQLVGALGNFLQEGRKADEILLKQLMEISNKNSERVIRAISSLYATGRHYGISPRSSAAWSSPPGTRGTRLPRSYEDNEYDDTVIDDILSLQTYAPSPPL